ncbi:RagB/SusD family nutrient uptake outer membrane protein [Chitinophaga pendula]|uniref:RagB/SusD family nutrient uptake outer membrane protein n=1 Tax=Chitinophaga TaxID=79328 RepID=UPI000BB075A6|nr:MULTISPECIES: RagB/SusD family nutrient uptake outer membrane protein [Chitinophaga]ASZ11119.1 hypothetical protein CK934_09165 [Chitinophaga sp. MD30]UCJ05884.1 RagB/SusD family nutrient uptake outer membrane protein [Chitinophaga pendula]
MKSKIYGSLLLLIICSSVACKKFLDEPSRTDLPAEKFWRNPDDAKLGVAAIYDGVQKTLSGNYTDWGDARSDNFTWGGTGENQINITLNGLNPTMGVADWTSLYRTVSYCNLAIKYLPTIELLPATERDNYLAQAYAIRGLMYFYAVRLWGNVPVRTIPYEDINQDPRIAQSTADDVMNNVILPDLNKAYELSDKRITSPVWYVNSGAILAMLTDAYLWKKDYAKVLENSTKLMALNRYALEATENWKKMFVEPASYPKENIWSLQWNALKDGGNGISKIGSGSNTSNYHIDSTVFLRFEADTNDIRRGYTYDTLVPERGERVTQIAKFYAYGPNGNVLYPNNNENEAKLPMYRFADVLLMRAEALNMTGDKGGAIALVNQVRRRARAKQLNAADYNSPKEVEKVILDERQLELFAEGKRWFDLRRTDRVVEVMDPILRYRQSQQGMEAVGFGDIRKVLFPISRSALTNNTLLVQNKPYSE